MIDSTSTTTFDPTHVVSPSDFEALYAAQKAENGRLKTILAVARVSPEQRYEAPTRNLRNHEQVRADLGQLGFLNASRQDKLVAVGFAPNDLPDDALLYKLFGRGADTDLAADLMKTNPNRYRALKQGALVTGLYGRRPPQ